jgi:hypothetical protein
MDELPSYSLRDYNASKRASTSMFSQVHPGGTNIQYPTLSMGSSFTIGVHSDRFKKTLLRTM